MPAMTCSVKREEENGGDRGAGRGKARRQKASHKWIEPNAFPYRFHVIDSVSPGPSTNSGTPTGVRGIMRASSVILPERKRKRERDWQVERTEAVGTRK